MWLGTTSLVTSCRTDRASAGGAAGGPGFFTSKRSCRVKPNMLASRLVASSFRSTTKVQETKTR